MKRLCPSISLRFKIETIFCCDRWRQGLHNSCQASTSQASTKALPCRISILLPFVRDLPFLESRLFAVGFSVTHAVSNRQLRIGLKLLMLDTIGHDLREVVFHNGGNRSNGERMECSQLCLRCTAAVKRERNAGEEMGKRLGGGC